MFSYMHKFSSLESVWISTTFFLNGAMFLLDKNITFLLFVSFFKNYANETFFSRFIFGQDFTETFGQQCLITN